MTERFETFTVLINRISRNIRKIKNHEMAEYDLRSAHVHTHGYRLAILGRNMQRFDAAKRFQRLVVIACYR